MNEPPLPQLNKPPQLDLTEPQANLIQKANRQHASIIIENEFKPGYSGARVFLVTPVKPNGTRDARVVTKVGPVTSLRRERDNYELHVARALPYSATQLRDYCEQDDLAALNYVFAGDDTLGKTISLEEYCLSHPTNEVIKTLTNLLDNAMGKIWYSESEPLNVLFRDQYGRHLPTHSELGTIMQTIFPNLPIQDSQLVRLPGLAETYSNPLHIYEQFLDMVLSGRKSLVHGDLHPQNVLVDETGKGWLIDYAKVEVRHNLFDFIKLETYIRQTVLTAQQKSFSWLEYTQMEQSLNEAALAPDKPAGSLSNSVLTSGYEIIQAIRNVARHYMKDQRNFQSEYLVGLFLYCLAMTKYHQASNEAATQLLFMTACVTGQFLLTSHQATPVRNQVKTGKSESSTEAPATPKTGGIGLYNISCGNEGINLKRQRLAVSSAFGSYFTGLLERNFNYIDLTGQVAINSKFSLSNATSLESIYWVLHRAKGPHLVIIAAEGGMGKSTLASRIIRCLYQEQEIDMILGDSAKTRLVDPVSGQITPVTPGYYTSEMFCERLCSQLGLPFRRGRLVEAIRDIQARLDGRQAVIVADNLETVAQGSDLIRALRQLANRDIRVIATSRTVAGIATSLADLFMIRLEPLNKLQDVQTFLNWHIDTHSMELPELEHLRPHLADHNRIHHLLQRTGGIPLLIQLIFSRVALASWKYIDTLPNLFGPDLLNHLYAEHWAELTQAGTPGEYAKKLLRTIAIEQYQGERITFDYIQQWASENRIDLPVPEILKLLRERFLLVNHDPQEGNYAIFPSLAEFLQSQSS